LKQTVAALGARQDPTDFWLAPIGLGYPLFHYYQHLPHVLLATLYALLSPLFRGTASVSDVLAWSRYLLLSLFPLSIYWSMRRLGFARVPAALAGLTSSLIATNGLYGLEFGTYVWSGYGLYTQLWGQLLLPPALAQGYAAVRDGRGYFWAIL